MPERRHCAQDSAHFKNEQRKQAQTDERIKRLQEKAAALSPAELAAHQRYKALHDVQHYEFAFHAGHAVDAQHFR